MSWCGLDLTFNLCCSDLELKNLSHGVIFNLDSAKVCSPAITEIHFSYDKDIWIAVTDYYMYFNLIVLFYW